MKFIIRAKKEKIDKMCKDLDKEIEQSKKIKKSRAYKTAVKVAGSVLKIPMLFVLDYTRLSQTKIQLMTVMAAGGFINKDAVKRKIINRAKGYGGVDVKVFD